MGQNVKSQITVHSGVKGGSYYKIANDIRKISTGTVVVKNTIGSYLNLKELSAGNLAFLQYDVLQNELLLDILKIRNKTDSIKIVLPLAQEEIHLIARSNADNSITSLADLFDRTVAIGSENTGTSLTATSIKAITGVEWNDSKLSVKAAISALIKGNIDAFFFVSSSPVDQFKVFSQLPPSDNITYRLIPIKNRKLDEYYARTIIKKGTYDWADYDVETYAVRSIIITNTTGETDAQRKELIQLLTDMSSFSDSLIEERRIEL